MYQATSPDLLRPGSCGFFDDDGFWSDIIDMTDAVSDPEFKAAEGYGTLETGPTTRSGPKFSESVTTRAAAITVNTGPFLCPA